MRTPRVSELEKQFEQVEQILEREADDPTEPNMDHEIKLVFLLGFGVLLSIASSLEAMADRARTE